MHLRAVIALIAVLSAFVLPATATELGTKEEAIAMVKRIQEKFKKMALNKPSKQSRHRNFKSTIWILLFQT